MRIISLNVNGVRAAARKGLFTWLGSQQADFVCLQEIRARRDQLGAAEFWPEGYHAHYREAERKGYSGVAVFAREAPDEVVTGMGWAEADGEGRYLELRYPGLAVVSVYVPSGSSGDERQAAKYRFMARFLEHLRVLRRGPREVVLCGDWNIAHKAIDLRNWRSNQKNSGFLPEERAWLDRVFGPEGYVDAFREVNQEEGQYTWWSNRGQAWARNVGWRLDYQVVTPGLRARVRGASVYREERFSDHAPLIIDYERRP